MKRRPGAVALRYNPDRDVAPTVVASGKGQVAERIIDLARRHNVPLYEDPDLVELLLVLELDMPVPEDLYLAVAEVLAFVYRLNRDPKFLETR